MPEKVCEGCGKLIRHCKCGLHSKESRHFDQDGRRVEDNSTDDLKKDIKNSVIKHSVNLGHDLLDRVGDELIGKKKDSNQQEKKTSRKKCAFCGSMVDDLSTHTCPEKDENVVEAEYEVVEEDEDDLRPN